MQVLVIGALGNMGRRYCAILRHLKVDHVGFDIETRIHEIFREIGSTESITHILIATPTETHYDLVASIRKFTNAPILSEKPFLICAGRADIVRLVEELDDEVYMVNNYNFLPKKNSSEVKTTRYESHYTGPDGKYWDCIQLIHLAEGKIELNDECWRWSVKINGESYTREDIDSSYYFMIAAFLSDHRYRLWGKPDIIAAHMKVLALIEKETECSS